MKNAYNKSNFCRPVLRAFLLVTLFVGPFAGFAVAAADENARDLKGAGLVLYVSLVRGQ